MIAIVGIMAAGLVMALNPLAQIRKANDAKRKSDLNQIQKALEAYYNDFGRYPVTAMRDTNPSFLSYKILSENNITVDWGSTGWQYMSPLPKDPSARRSYVYYSNNIERNQSYRLYANLERGTNDPQACKNQAGSQTNCPGVPDGAVCGTGMICNYGVSSPNVSP